MNEPCEFTVRRIVVALDTSPHGSAALEAAAQLAAELRAELHGLFIEDAGLLRLAGLPFAIEIDDSGRRRPLDLPAMEQSLRAKAEGVRRAVAEAAQRTSLRWSFQIARGNLAETMLSESLEDELVLIGWEEVATAQHSRAPRGPVMVIDEGTPASSLAIDMAKRLARGRADALVVLSTRAGADAPPRDALAASSCYFQRCSADLDGLLLAVRQWRPQLLLLNRCSPFVTESSLKVLVARLPCPLLLMQASEPTS